MSKKKWKTIRNKLRKIRDIDRENKEKYDKDKNTYKGRFSHVWSVDPYLSVPPMEFYGKSMNAEEVLKIINVEEDSKKVSAFKTLFGKEFNCGGDENLFEKIMYQIEMYEKNVEKEVEKEKEREKEDEESDEQNDE